MTFAFHPFHDSYDLTNTHSLPPNLPSDTASTSLPEPAFPANYNSWGLAPTSPPAQYGPPAGFHHGDETHGLPLDMHLPDASSLLFGSYAPPLEISQLSPSAILRHDAYESVLGNVFNPVAPTGLAPQAPISLPTLFPCLAPPASLPAQTDPLASASALPSDPLQSTSPPGRPACAKRVSKRKGKRSVSREVDLDPHITSQLQAANHGLHSSTSAATPKSPREMRGFIGRGGSSNRMAPPPVPPLQPGHPPRSSSGIQHQQQHQQHQQPQPGYSTVPVGSMDERYAKRRRVDDGQSPSGLSVAQQQQQMAGYLTQQYQSQAPAHWYGSGAQPTNAPVSQPPQPSYGYPSTSAGPSYSRHAHPAHASTRNLAMYAAPISTASSQWTSGNSIQGQGQYYYSGTTVYSQPTQAYQQQQPPYTSPTHAYQALTPAGSSSSGSGSIARPTPPISSGPIPPSATVPPDMRPLTSSAGCRGVPTGYSAAASVVGSQAAHGGSSGGNPLGTGHAAPVMIDSVNRFASEFPPTLPTLTLEDGPFSHVPPYLAQANLTASGETPNPGAVGGTSTMAEPTSPSQHVGSSRSDRTNRRQAPKPYQRPTPAARKTRPVTYEGNLARLQQRCRGQGADEGAIGLLGKVFANGVSLEALIRQLTDEEADTNEFGIETGRIYIAFLETINDEEGVVSHYVCRLCHTEQTWKHHKDALRHLRRDHFGLADVCKQWYVFGRSLSLVGINMFPRRC
jgi:hypothetical protein